MRGRRLRRRGGGGATCSALAAPKKAALALATRHRHRRCNRNRPTATTAAPPRGFALPPANVAVQVGRHHAARLHQHHFARLEGEGVARAHLLLANECIQLNAQWSGGEGEQRLWLAGHGAKWELDNVQAGVVRVKK